MDSYLACSIQPEIQPVLPRGQPFCSDALQRNVGHLSRLIRKAHDETGAQLYVLPEFGLQGYTPSRSVADWISASIKLPGPESDNLAAVANELGVFICAAAYESIPEFPGRFWNTAFIIDDQGDIPLRYRKLYSTTAKTRPGDVFDAWISRYGPDSLFPVIDTRLGRLAALVARDTHWPEVARCLTLHGAEILLNPMGAIRRQQMVQPTAVNYIRMVRAYENCVYLIAANIGPFVGGENCDPAREPSEICDYKGVLLARGPASNEGFISAVIDIQSLRRHRTTVGDNLVAQLQPELHASVLSSIALFPTNVWLENPLGDAVEHQEIERQVIRRMLADRLILAPES